MADFINWADYYGLNEGDAQAQANDLAGGIDNQGAAAANAAAQLSAGAGAAGYSGGSYDDSGVQDQIQSYGDAVRALKNPDLLRAQLNKAGPNGRRRASSLDAAMVQQAGSNRFQQSASVAPGQMRDAERSLQRGSERFAAGGARRQQDDAARAAEAETAAKAKQMRDLEAANAMMRSNGGPGLPGYKSQIRPDGYSATARRVNTKPAGESDWEEARRLSEKSVFDNDGRAFAKDSPTGRGW